MNGSRKCQEFSIYKQISDKMISRTTEIQSPHFRMEQGIALYTGIPENESRELSSVSTFALTPWTSMERCASIRWKYGMRKVTKPASGSRREENTDNNESDSDQSGN